MCTPSGGTQESHEKIRDAFGGRRTLFGSVFSQTAATLKARNEASRTPVSTPVSTPVGTPVSTPVSTPVGTPVSNQPSRKDVKRGASGSLNIRRFTPLQIRKPITTGLNIV